MQRGALRKSTFFLIFFCGSVLALTLLVWHADLRVGAARQLRAANLALVKDLGLTDLCLFGSARYTRHLALADYYAAFQDHPMALEHFPAGSIAVPRQSKN